VATINARLRALGMSSVRTSAGNLPTPLVALMWGPQVSGNPGVPGNSARAFYPGSAYVDWICTDFYSGYPTSAASTALL
jgi:beta-mannanase